MKVLIFSDSHSARSFMRLCVDKIQPDVILHLGDHFDDAEALSEEYPNIPLHAVAGNCDKYRAPIHAREIMTITLGGVSLYMTHGHIHRVKQVLSFLVRDARAAKADAALFGHTHVAYCEQESDGLWVVNPGSCGYYGGSAAIMEIRDKKIISCRIIRQEDL